jgi:hypothetical protein
MEGKKQKDILKFFEDNPAGNYIMWKESHVVLVCDATVYEFSEGYGGFRSLPIAEWPIGSATFWIRKVNKEFGAFEPGFTAVTAPAPKPPNRAAVAPGCTRVGGIAP